MKRASILLALAGVMLAAACDDGTIVATRAYSAAGTGGAAGPPSNGGIGLAASAGSAANQGGSSAGSSDAAGEGGMLGEAGSRQSLGGGNAVDAGAHPGGAAGETSEAGAAGDATGGAPPLSCDDAPLAAAQCIGNVELGSLPTLRPAGTPFALTIGNFNGDGVPDVAVANSANKVSVMLGRGNGTFEDPVDAAVGAEPWNIASGYFNADEYLDVVTSNFGDSTLSILLGNGDGTFQPAATVTAGFKARGVTAARIDADTLIDLVVVNYSANTVYTYLGNGDGTFKNPTTSYLGSNSSGVTVGDYNGDTKPDLAVVAGNVTILLGKGDGTFQSMPKTFALNSGGAKQVVAGYFDEDDVLDLAGANPGNFSNGGTAVSVLIGNGDGTFQPQVLYPVGENAQSVAIGDFDDDGESDLIVAVADPTGKPAESVSMLLGNGDGTFQPAVDYLAGKKPFFVAVADLDADQDDDVLVANGYIAGSYSSNDVSVLLGDGAGHLRVPSLVPATQGVRKVASLELNGDCWPDLAVLNVTAKNVSVFLTNPNGSYQAAVPYAISSEPSSMLVGDTSGDGLPDLEVGTALGLFRLLGDGQGGFGEPIARGGSGALLQLASGDFNSDGVLDVVEVGGGVNGCVSVNLGGTDPWLGCYGGNLVVQGVAVGDIDGDAKLDLVVAQASAAQLSVLRGNGDGTFQAFQTQPGFGGLGIVATGDLDGDHDDDIVASANEVATVLLNDGAGNFAPPSSYPFTGYLQSESVLADIDGDGSLDLVGTKRLSDQVGVLFNDGHGAFSVEQTYAVGAEPWGLTANDFDRDGNQDVAIACSLGGSITLLKRTGCVP